MKKASEYRQHAAECRALAAKMMHDEERSQLLGMATTWDRLADERARSAELEERPAFKRDWPA